MTLNLRPERLAAMVSANASLVREPFIAVAVIAYAAATPVILKSSRLFIA